MENNISEVSKVIENEDPLAAARGVLYGLFFSFTLWTLIIGLLCYCVS